MIYRALRSNAAIFCLMVMLAPELQSQAIVADHSVISEFESIPEAAIQGIGSDVLAYYAHTSHGSQIMTGLTMLEAEDALYQPPYFYEVSDDLGGAGDTSWVPACRVYLNSHNTTNLVMFSWCGGCSDNTEEGINIYLNKMTELEADYPDMNFVYMTGHLDGSGADGNLYARNNQIRQYCLDFDKILFDFADIESYNPDGDYFPDGSDACEWCYDWCALYTCPTCADCAHSHCFNCYLKGKAWWWMMAQVVGGADCYSTTDVNDDGITLSAADLTYLNDYVYGSGPRPPQLWQGDINGDGYIDALDIERFNLYFEIGLGAFPEFPIPTVCNPDTFRTACCGVDDSCVVLAYANCHDADGGLVGGSMCQNLSCDTISIGACCDSALNCYIRSEWECTNLGNDFVGDGISCDPYPCIINCCAIRGDITHDGSGPDIADLVYLVNFMFNGGPEPLCPEEADIDGNMTGPDIADLVYLVNFMFNGGPAPVECP